TLAISATVSLCVYTAWKKMLPSALRRWYRRIPHPVARQRPGINPQIRARDHGGIVGGEKHRGSGVVRWTGALAEWHPWRGSAEEAAPAWARVRWAPKGDAPLCSTCHALRSVCGCGRQTVDTD